MPLVRFEVTASDALGPVTAFTLRATAPLDFKAGQYLVFHHPDGGEIPMSIASPPRRLPYLTLHYRSTPGVQEAMWFDDLIARGAPLDATGPLGDVWVAHGDSNDRPLLLIAGGTGASQATAIVEELRAARPARSVTMLWSVAEPRDLYQDPYFARLANEPWLDYRAFVDDRRGRNQLIPWLSTLDVSEHGQDDVILCGGPAFVYAVVDALVAIGFDAARMASDVFSYAPRD